MAGTKREKLMVVDGNSLLYRAFFALPNLTTSDGQHTNAVYGFSMMLLRLLDEEKPDYCVVAFDAPGPTFRHEAYAEYKATRQKTPDELRSQGPLARQVCQVLSIPILEVPGVEADDVVGTVARYAERESIDVLIVTGDMDALQLVTERVHVLATRRGITDTVRYDPEAVEERYGVRPELIPDLKALTGDPSDNIPGVRGIGMKTAVKLLQRYGSVEGLLQARDEVPEPRIRQALQDAGEQPRESRVLATIVTDVELDAGLEAWRCQEPDRPKARELFDQLEFRSLRSRFDEDDTVTAAPVSAQPLATIADLDRLVSRACARRGVALALAPTPERGGQAATGAQPELDLGQDARRLPELAGLGLGVDDGVYVWDPTKSEVTLAMLRPLLEDPRVPKCAHDLKALHIACWRAGFELKGGEFDPMVADYLLNPARSSHALNDLAFDHLGYELPPEGAEGALAARAAATYALWGILQERLREENLDGLNRDLEVPLISVLARMEREGIAVAVDRLRALAARLNQEAQALEKEIHELAGMEFNIGSTKQLQFVLFEKLGLPPEKKTKTGYSTGVEVLERLSHLHPIAGKILAYRELTKLRSTYAEALPRLTDPLTGRVHTSLNQAVAATGRLSSSEPNLQNIPVRTEIGREIRRAFIAPTGTLLVSADYSQIELRLLAHVTGDKEMVRAFNADEDIHVTTASALFGVPEAEVTEEMRRRAKTVNFAVIYGMSEFGLARDLGVSPAVAREWIANYFGRYPGVLEYKERVIAQAQRDGFVTTLMGRRRYLPEITSRNRNFREFAERAAVNTPIQGTAADIIKMAMVQIDALLREEGFRTRMILQVHDELLFEAPQEEKERLVPRIREIMEGVLPLRVRLKVDIAAGPNWADMEKLAA
ncbi:MAG TPA: DNA polymerase I [Armatimonadota bacterium]|nr:DNA polymerase I [Armatimonadota bacterium]HOM81878.1 DNA polymerase I [Armatimonadota bacterium]HPO73246.1 DNA polymerase I [Armatimonadota bacterium]HPT96443.1 DNA polymerase I [Armatimonadota bacterium]